MLRLDSDWIRPVTVTLTNATVSSSEVIGSACHVIKIIDEQTVQLFAPMKHEPKGGVGGVGNAVIDLGSGGHDIGSDGLDPGSSGLDPGSAVVDPGCSDTHTRSSVDDTATEDHDSVCSPCDPGNNSRASENEVCESRLRINVLKWRIGDPGNKICDSKTNVLDPGSSDLDPGSAVVDPGCSDIATGSSVGDTRTNDHEPVCSPCHPGNDSRVSGNDVCESRGQISVLKWRIGDPGNKICDSKTNVLDLRSIVCDLGGGVHGSENVPTDARKGVRDLGSCFNDSGSNIHDRESRESDLGNAALEPGCDVGRYKSTYQQAQFSL